MHPIIGGHNECFEMAQKSPEKLDAFSKMCPGSGAGIDTSKLESIALATRSIIGVELYSSSLVFAFVRNPYDRAVSSWMYTYSWKLDFPAFCELLAERGPYHAEWT